MPRDLLHLDYGALDSPSVIGSFSAAAVRPGTAHGLCLWFDTTLFGTIGFSNELGRTLPAIYG